MGIGAFFRRLFRPGPIQVDYSGTADDRLKSLWRERHKLTGHAVDELTKELARRGIEMRSAEPEPKVEPSFDPAWRAILQKRVPFYDRLPPARRARFEQKLAQFVETKRFVPADGMTITDEVKVVIAATACRLMINLPILFLEPLQWVKVHPKAFRDSSGRTVCGIGCREFVEIAWRELLQGLKNPSDGFNPGYHEFAHVLDALDGLDGVPPCLSPLLYGYWVEVMNEEFVRAVRGQSWLSPYSATDKLELFAVATEMFFEMPKTMRTHHPDLFEILAAFYRQRPSGSR